MVPTPAGTPGRTEEYRKAASYPQGIVSECGQVLRRLATDLVVVVCRPCWRLPGEHSHSAAGHSSLESQSLEQMEIEQRKEGGGVVAISRHLPQLMAVLADCCAVLGTSCHLSQATPGRGDRCGPRCRPFQQPIALLNAGPGLYRN